MLLTSNALMNPTITVVVVTYNQEEYIGKCIESILEQQCTVPYNVIIADDCSKDNSRSIIRSYQIKYPERIVALLQETNRGVLLNYADAIDLAKGKYICFCDGDDYWCDSLKLQKQYDCLESRPGYGVVRTAGWRLLENGIMEDAEDGACDLEGDVRSLTNYGPIGLTSTFFFNRDLLQYIDIRDWAKRGITMEDYPMNAIFAHHTKFAYLNDKTAVYRATPISVSKGRSVIKTLYYMLGWVAAHRYLRSLYPDELGNAFPENECLDHDNYIKLKISIYHGKYREALKRKKSIETLKFKNKYSYRLFKGPLTFIFLFLLIHNK